MIQAFFNKLSQVQFKQDENYKTSSSIGLLQYLPDDVFWKVIGDSCNAKNVFTSKNLGKIVWVNFWPYTDATNTTNKRNVEPDVLIETEEFDIIIEAKEENNSHTLKQWKNEIQSIKNEQKKNNKEKGIILIALGGHVKKEIVSKVNNMYLSSWQSLLNAIDKEMRERKNNDHVCRILADVLDLFERQGMLPMQWFKSLDKIDINETCINQWKQTATN